MTTREIGSVTTRAGHSISIGVRDSIVIISSMIGASTLTAREAGILGAYLKTAEGEAEKA